MNGSVPQKIGVGFAISAFGFLVFGSLIAGATFFTAVLRGFQAAITFGSVAWLLGWLLLKDETDESESISDKEISEDKSKNKIVNSIEAM